MCCAVLCYTALGSGLRACCSQAGGRAKHPTLPLPPAHFPLPAARCSQQDIAAEGEAAAAEAGAEAEAPEGVAAAEQKKQPEPAAAAEEKAGEGAAKTEAEAEVHEEL